jgi:hydroxymethyl cephem carbamoyltransferase
VLIVAFKPGHDGSVAAIGDGRLLFSLEAEKDSYARYSLLSPVTLLELADELNETPDVVALSGWQSKVEAGERAVDVRGTFGAGYFGAHSTERHDSTFFGKRTRYFSGSHERSHIFGAIGMAPATASPLEAVLVWEGITGSFYLVDDRCRVVRDIPVLAQPGARFAALFAICDPTFPVTGGFVRLNDSGKLMALAAFGDATSNAPPVTDAVERILALPNLFPVPKGAFADSPLFDCGVTSELCKTAAAVLTERIFQVFADAAVRKLPPRIPLRISGGCGLNCDWNAAWRNLGHFESVFVAPCPNDSGSAIGTAIDALASLTGGRRIEWDVYAGLEFVHDVDPPAPDWRSRPLDHAALAHTLAEGQVVAWVQGRWEIGPRALGNRSLLAEPFSARTRERLNEIKAREEYRPIAPCARVEDLAATFDGDFEDPYMLYFRRVRDPRLQAITHVDGSARVQTVSACTNPPQHALLSAFAEHSGVGVLCNTSLNFNGHGFINRMSHLIEYCQQRHIAQMVVGDTWYTHTDA